MKSDNRNNYQKHHSYKKERTQREHSKDEIPFREMTAAQKRSYLWDYWKIPALVVIVAAVFLISLIHSMVTTKKPLFSVTVVDSSGETGIRALAETFAAQNGIPEDQLVLADTVVGNEKNGGGAMSQAGMAFFVRMQGGSEDVVILPEDTFTEFAQSGYFMDLTDIVGDAWKDKLIVVDQRYDDYENEQPEPMACALHLSDIEGLPDNAYNQDAVIAISYNPAHADTAAAFLHALLAGELL